jgi:hypothetical protein
LFGKAALVHGPHRVRIGQAGAEIGLEVLQHGPFVPLGFREEPLQHPLGSVGDFRQVFGIAALRRLDQQAAQIILATRPPLLAAKGGRELGMKLTKALFEPGELLHVQRTAPAANGAARLSLSHYPSL